MQKGRILRRSEPEAASSRAFCAVSGGYTALNRITDVIRVASPRITLRLYAKGPAKGRRCKPAGKRGPHRSAASPAPRGAPSLSPSGVPLAGLGAVRQAFCRRCAAVGHCAGLVADPLPGARPGASKRGRSSQPRRRRVSRASAGRAQGRECSGISGPASAPALASVGPLATQGGPLRGPRPRPLPPSGGSPCRPPLAR